MVNQEFRYSLEKYQGARTKYKCPGCKRKGMLSKYIDNETNEYLADHVGLCDRISSCGYHFTPKMYFAENGFKSDKTTFIPIPKQAPKSISFIDKDIFINSRANNNPNYFINYLVKLFGTDIARKLIDNYKIATSDNWAGSTVFWQIDLKDNIRTGKIMLYDEVTGKRVKQPFNHIAWVHTSLKQSDFNLKQCLFGLPLMKDNDKPIAIVESEKTAIIASVYLPQFIWLASGNIQNLNSNNCSPLIGRKVVLYPDLNAVDKWSLKANEFNFKISDILERSATEMEKAAGLDVADYLTKFNYKEFLPIVKNETPVININALTKPS